MADVDIYPIPGFNEPFSSLSHLAGAAVFAILTIPLLHRARRDRERLAFLGFYAFSTVLLLATSGVYHLLDPGRAPREVLVRLDHAAIVVLIAASFTAVHGILFKGIARCLPLILLWVIAGTAVTVKMIYFRELLDWRGLTIYLALGWAGLITGIILWIRYGTAFIMPLALGGLMYTAGAVLEFLRWPVLIPGVVGPHELFHVAVLAGIGLHWRFMFGIAGENGRVTFKE